MANVDIHDITKVNHFPIHHIRIGIAGGGDYYYNLEDGSNWSLKPVIDLDDCGRERTVAFKFEGNFIVLQNNYPDMLDGLKNLVSNSPSDFDMWLSPAEGDTNIDMTGLKMQISVDNKSGQTPLVKLWSGSFSFDGSKDAPKLSTHIIGLFSNDIFSKCDIFTIY